MLAADSERVRGEATMIMSDARAVGTSAPSKFETFETFEMKLYNTNIL
jgi:hypothetical protein